MVKYSFLSYYGGKGGVYMLLFVIPVYRVSPQKWDDEFKDKYNEVITDKEDYQLNRHYVHWKYNDVVAWIEVSYEVFKLKGRVFKTDNKRYQRNFKAIFKSNHNIGDIDIHTKGRSNEEIISDLVDKIERYRKRVFPNRFIDTKVIYDSGKYLDFQKMYDDRVSHLQKPF